MKRKDKRNVENSLRQVAKNHGVSVEEVKREIERALELGQTSLNPTAQGHWKKMTSNDSSPTIEKFLLYIANKIKS